MLWGTKIYEDGNNVINVVAKLLWWLKEIHTGNIEPDSFFTFAFLAAIKHVLTRFLSTQTLT